MKLFCCKCEPEIRQGIFFGQEFYYIGGGHTPVTRGPDIMYSILNLTAANSGRRPPHYNHGQ